MVRVAKGKGRNKKEKQVSSDSDDDHYGDDFDPKNPFGDDPIESFNSNRDKIFLNSMKNSKAKAYDDDSAEEVLAFDDDDDDEDDDDENYDIDDEEKDDDEIYENDEEVLKASKDNEDELSYWGRKKSAYYSGNKIQNEDDAQLEEEEANLLQAKMMKQLDTNDFGLDAFKLTNKDKTIMKTNSELESNKFVSSIFDESKDDKSLEKIAKNLSKLSKKEKLELLQQDSPELFELVKDFKAKINELEDVLLPIFGAIKKGQLPNSNASEFIAYKTKLYLMYCSHLSFYFSLKSQRTPVDNHPIVKNILQFRNLCKQIAPIDEKLVNEIIFVLNALKSGKPLIIKKESNTSQSNRMKKSVRFRDAANMRNNLTFDDDNESEEEIEGDADEDESEQTEKRAINYQIEKNKGLTPKRNKMYRNPRVRNRIKARKAVIKRKSIVPNTRPQDKRYSGEATGIRSNIIRAVKIK